jgi:hypothetical protein
MLTATSSATGLPNLGWLTYSATIATTPTSLAPPNILITGYVGDGLGSVTFSASAGIFWVRVGQVVNVSGITEDPMLNAKSYLITSVDYAAKTITATIPQNPDNWRESAFAVTNNSPTVGGIISLVVMAQQVTISVPSGGATVSISPDSVSLANSYGWFTTITSGNSLTLTSPTQFKFNMADLYMTVGGGTQAVNILCI